MPRSQGMPYEIHPGPQRDEQGRPLLYVRPMSQQKKTVEEMDEYLAKHTGMQRGELIRAFTAFEDAAKWFLSSGVRVETTFGTLSPSLRMLREETDPHKVTANDIMFDGIQFTPSKSFVESVRRLIKGFSKVSNAAGNDQMYDREQMLRALDLCFAGGEGMVTVRHFQVYSGLHYHSARRCLDDFCEGDNPILRRTRMGRTYIYTRA